MKFILLIISLGLLYTQLNAQRIMITKTSKKSNLSHIKKQLDKLHIKMYYKKSDINYIVYSQNFSSQNQTDIAFKKIKQHFTSAYISQESKKKKETQKTENTKYNFFVNIGLGSSSYLAQESTGDSYSIGGSNYFLEGGYSFNDYSFIAINYLNINSTGGSMNNFSTALNLNYPVVKNTNIYAGLLLGYSSFSLDIANSTPSTSPTAGIQVGASYDILGYIPVSLTYQFISTSHLIIYPNNISVDFTPIQNINLGVGYRF
ncbi:MAG: outer membrane beta-barrel protein [Campylobacterota bacterium]|nr:outer membrane beta-barrel protein [Campylobacterota bacterium]